MIVFKKVAKKLSLLFSTIKHTIENHYSSDSSGFLQTNIMKVLTFISFVSILEFTVFIYSIHSYKSYTQHQIDVFSYNHSNDTYFKGICDMINCKQVLLGYTVRYDRINVTDFNIILEKNDHVVNTHKFMNLLLDDHNDIILNYNHTPVIIDMSDIYSVLKYIYIISIILLSMLFVSFMILSLKRERTIALKSLAGNEAILTNKSFILITENIHHELNTPLEVIDNKLEKIHSVISEYISRKNPNHNKIDIDHQLMNLEEDFSFIKQSSEQIYSVLDKTRGFKHLRYSNGNKSIYDIIDGAFKIMSISNSNFIYKIDEKLNEFKLNYKIVKDFKNADLLNIILNHIKNSLEANSNKIHIVFNSYSKNTLVFSIIDNGNGVKPHLIKRVFSPNFSTKSSYDNVIRGNGLYLNKSILNSSQGDVVLLDSTQYGATFQIKIIVLPK